MWSKFICCRECLCAVGHLSLWGRLFYGNNLLAVGRICVLWGDSLCYGFNLCFVG